MTYTAIAIDPRNVNAAVEELEQWRDQGAAIIGFEVTHYDVANVLHANYDPQHTGQDSSMSCIMKCWRHADNFTWNTHNVYVTSRVDLDSIGGMAIHSMSNDDIGALARDDSRITRVHEADIFSHGEWEEKELFGQTDGYNAEDLAPIAKFVTNWKLPLEERVEGMREWLLHFPCEWLAPYEDLAISERQEIFEAFESGETTSNRFLLASVDRTQYCTVVKSKLRAATSIGYTSSPVVVAVNPCFSFSGGQPHRKVTICQYNEGYVDLKAVFARLGEGWGGSPTIGGSPQGIDCQTSIDEILAAITEELI